MYKVNYAYIDTLIIKGRLHEYIERADDKHLEAIYILPEKEMNNADKYDRESLDMLYERRNKHLNGEANHIQKRKYLIQ